MKKTFVTTLIATIAYLGTYAQGFQNPILPGFYPDPSVCRVGSDYYLVNSSFQYFPGVPIHHSRDLVHWEQIGYCLTRESQLHLPRATFWTGIYAPTIRYHNGLFYMVTTNVSDRGNFFVTATNASGPWSEPVWVNQPGIDPTLFWDDDGKCYFLSTSTYILLSEIDPQTGHLSGTPKRIWHGTGGRYPEGPHLYKKDGFYYLMIAEGGTEYGHKVTIARSRQIDGPYEANPSNPILTHINDNGATNSIQGTGHADLVQAPDSSWWMVCLGFRPQSYSHHLLGRETFLAPVRWDKGAWPVVNGDGTIKEQMNCATLPEQPMKKAPERDNFEEKELGFDWNYLCNPTTSNYSLSAHKGNLRLQCSTLTPDSMGSPTFVGRRQQHIRFCATTSVNVSGLKEGSEAGLSVYMCANYHYDISVRRKDGATLLTLTYHLGLLNHVEKQITIKSEQVALQVIGSADTYNFGYAEGGENIIPLGAMDTRFLSSETAGGFTGIFLGLYANSKKENGSYADFDYFDYKPL